MTNKNEFIADKIEEAIRNMFANFRTYEFAPTEYSIFYNPKKHSYWFIVIYFADIKTLKAGMNQGLCYQIYSYLLNELNSIPEISGIFRSISFEFEKRPTEMLEIENAIAQLVDKMNAQQRDAGKPDIKICGSCGHDFDKHQLMCNLLEEKVPPKEGWIICPEENCTCFKTWGANYIDEEAKKTSKIGKLFNKIFTSKK